MTEHGAELPDVRAAVDNNPTFHRIHRAPPRYTRVRFGGLGPAPYVTKRLPPTTSFQLSALIKATAKRPALLAVARLFHAATNVAALAHPCLSVLIHGSIHPGKNTENIWKTIGKNMSEPASYEVNDGNFNKRSSTWVPWSIAGVGLVSAGLIAVFVALPALQHSEEVARELEQAKAELSSAKSAASAQEAQLAELLADKDNLTQTNTAVREQLESALREKETALAELEQTRKELNEAFGTQISAGDVLIQERKGELVIDVSDRLLFDSGETEVNDKGKTFLREVAKTMRRLPAAQVFRVGGHTDTQRIVTKQLAERYPTNWELSTARATNVVRFLQEEGKVPGHQLIAAGFSQYRPAASNQTDAGRQKNRRIEIVLQRIRKDTR